MKKYIKLFEDANLELGLIEHYINPIIKIEYVQKDSIRYIDDDDDDDWSISFDVYLPKTDVDGYDTILGVTNYLKRELDLTNYSSGGKWSKGIIEVEPKNEEFWFVHINIYGGLGI